jgi:hypothetical protein
LPSYLYLASQCPVLPVPTSGLQNPASVNPLINEATIQGESSGTVRGKMNRAYVRSEMMGRHGAGAYAVATGLNLSIGTGLAVTVAPGFAMIDAPKEITVATDVTVSNGVALGSIWLTQAGALTPSTNLTPPAGNVAYLGLYTSAGGVVTVVDESGVLRWDQGGLLMRRTADTTTPTDTPSATLRFLTKCPGGLFLWTGTEYFAVGGDASGLSPTVIASGEVWTIPAGRQAVVATLDVQGTLTVNGLLKLVGD